MMRASFVGEAHRQSLARRPDIGDTTRLQRHLTKRWSVLPNHRWPCVPMAESCCFGSSVHRQRGYCYRKYKELHGNDQADDICWLAPSKVMNPRLPQSVVDAAILEDPARGNAEYGIRWREDMADFVPPDVVEAVADYGIERAATARRLLRWLRGCVDRHRQ